MVKKNLTKKFVFVLAGLGLILLVGLVLIYNSKFGKVDLEVGDVAEDTIKASKSLFFESESRTEAVRDSATTDVATVYSLNPEVYNEQEELFDATVSNILGVLESSDDALERSQKIGEIIKDSEGDLAAKVAEMDKNKWESVSQELKRILRILQTKEEITEENVTTVGDQMGELIGADYTNQEQEIIEGLGRDLLLVNSYPDEAKTDLKKQEALKDVSPVYINVSKDEVILYQGQEVDSLAMEKLGALGYLSPSYVWQSILGDVFISAILIIISLLYIYFYTPRKLGYKKTILIFGASIVILILAAKIIIPLKPILGYAIPVVSFVVLLSLLANFEIGALAAAIFPVFYGLAADNSFELMIIQMIVSFIGLLALRNVENLSKFFQASIYIFIGVFLSSLSFHFAAGVISWEKIAQFAVISLGHALAAVILIYSGLAFLGHMLRVTTFLKLLELASPMHPLLKDLSAKAPGTYQHSLMVGNLAESAARSVKADTLFCKVAAMYHDIGKLYNPSLFLENQKRPQRLDDRASLKESAAMLIKHVTEGVSMAEKARLPNEVIGVIKSHHGTTMASYFYDVIEENSKKRVSEQDFRYSGPKPRTKEEAIIMLADSIEAAMRSVDDEEAKMNVIGKIIKERLVDGQLDESALTLADIGDIRTSFLNYLSNVSHSRINYDKER